MSTEDLTFLHEPEVRLIDVMGDDSSVTRAARVSTTGENEVAEDDKREAGLIRYLMSHRHGSPFEHATFTWYVKAPIFVFREFHRHRIASYNEMSGRYTTLPPEFYVPAEDRPLVNVGSSARPEFAPGTEEQYRLSVQDITEAYEFAWNRYQAMLERGIANEVARTVLPVGIMSQMYVTMNLRALMNFLSLRVDHPQAAVRSRPQYEIQQVAERMEVDFSERFPLVYAAFTTNGRVAP